MKIPKLPPVVQGVVDWIIDDWIWKVISVLVAMLIFFSVRETVSHTYTVLIPVEAETHGDTAVESVQPMTVSVTFRGTAADIQRIQFAPEKLAIAIEPTEISEGGQDIRLSSRNVKGAPNLRVDSIEPSVVNVQMDWQADVEFQVAEPPQKGKPLRGTAHLDYSPKTVRLRGAARSLEKMKEAGLMIATEPVDVDGRVQSFNKTVKILSPGGLRLWEISPAEVQVDVNIVQQETERVASNLWVNVVQSKRDDMRYRADPLFVNVKFKGRSDALEALDLGDVRVYAEETGHIINGGAGVTNRVPLRVMIPVTNSVDSITIEPDAVLLVPATKQPQSQE